uniref:Cytochrome c oxidase polypeptide II n=1 Tax=Paraurostyla sp. TaxID=6014 RepID=A0A3Q8C557_9STIC|nr:Cox2 [Paraurostyla sp.]
MFFLISTEIINYINQTEDIFSYNNLENLKTIYHYSIPNTKLFYPEPFIAAASFMHSDLWFTHILIYQYWLWFVFIFMIIFFTITFVSTIRWCNMRIKPRRETRGVSRSKCGDLITACVPVSWATSIIVNESTDAIDYYDGFGTTELVIGIRAYQWGWEYYYPKDIDLNYNIKKNYSSFIGNSLKYNKSSDINISYNNVWKYYQNKNFDNIITPAHLLILPLDNLKLINFLNFNDVGSTSLHESNIFKRIKTFSKIFNSSLFFSNNNFFFKYKKFTNLYINDDFYSESSLYGIKRQQNFLSSKSLLPNQSTFLNNESIYKLFKNNLNLNFKNTNKNIKTNLFNVNYFFTNNYDNTNTSNLIKLHLNFYKNQNITSNKFFFKFLNKTSLLDSINNDNDKKKINYPIFKLFNKKINNKNNNFNYSLNDLNLMKKKYQSNLFFNNKNFIFKNFFLFSTNQSTSFQNKTIKSFVNINGTLPTLNYSKKTNTLTENINFSTNSFNTNSFFFFNTNNLNWPNLTTNLKLLNTKTTLSFPSSPIVSSNLKTSYYNYDSLKKIQNESPFILQGKEEATPNHILSIYWNFFFSNSGLSSKLENNYFLNLITNYFYLPNNPLYYDYNFKNLQFLELFEDSLWESIYSIYTYDEYLFLKKDFFEEIYFEKSLNIFNIYNKIWNKKYFFNEIIGKSSNNLFLKNKNQNSFYYSFFQDDFFNINELTSNKNLYINSFNLFIINIFDNEDGYDIWKNLFSLFNNSLISVNNSYQNFFYPISYSTVMNYFRSDFDEFFWQFDNSILNIKNNDLFKIFKEKITVKSNLLPLFSFSDLFNENLEINKNSRSTNDINLRNTTKNAIVTFNSIQKIFRTKFDENRSYSRLTDLSNSYSKQQYLTSPRSNYEKFLGKNKNNFYKNNFYKNNFKFFLNNLYSLNSSTNFYFYDFPFLLAYKSDSSRYLWFDWYSKWGYYEVQPSSSAKYAIHGMPYFVKPFNFNTNNNEVLNETETYLIRIARARKNYLPLWSHAPYFYSKNKIWYKKNFIFNNLNLFKIENYELIKTKYLLNSMNWYWTKFSFFNFNNKQFVASISNISSYNKGSHKPENSIQNYFYTISTLLDILTKREFLLRELMFKKNKIISIPFYLTNSPKNPIIKEVKSNFLFFNSVLKNNEYSRDLYFFSLNFFNFIVLKDFLKNLNIFNSTNDLIDYFYFYFFSTKYENLLFKNNNSILLKNQYRPLKKGINNMIRLHATKAMALPIEIRLQILASSKDVIHSWAIPSAGIKIDCIPGYSSHRVMIFLVSGIFWGQCMEICGRYHHWMPIVVYFMKRDLFFLWCTHFVFLNNVNNQNSINDRQFLDYARIVSFDKLSWLTELK